MKIFKVKSLKNVHQTHMHLPEWLQLQADCIGDEDMVSHTASGGSVFGTTALENWYCFLKLQICVSVI